MKKLLILGFSGALWVVLVVFALPMEAASGGGAGSGEGAATLGNGDVNGDDSLDLSDAIYLLAHLFQGGPEPEDCPVLGSPEVCDNNADDDLDGATDCDDVEDCEADFNCLEPGDASLLPDTGVTDCYDLEGNIDPECDDCPGQDGSYRTSCQMLGRFDIDDGGTPEDTSDDTVTDNCTGLMWQLETSNGGLRLRWCGALKYCDEMVLAGFDDWRLPNSHELGSLIDYGVRGPAVAEPFRFFTASTFGALDVHFYWASTFYISAPPCGGPARAWGLESHGGGQGAGAAPDDKDPWSFRAVRTVSPAGGGAAQGRGAATLGNGDVNGDDSLDLSDAIYLLSFLFQGGPMPVPCPGSGAAGGGAGIGGAPLPDTGAKDCYHHNGIRDEECDDNPEVTVNCPGQDAVHAATTGCSVSPRFVDNLDGTITDNCTNLMWQQDTADTTGDGGTATGDFTSHCFDTNDNPLPDCNDLPAGARVVRLPEDGLPWCEALQYCEDLTFATHSDWRLPNIRELRSIVNHARGKPAIFAADGFACSVALPTPNADTYRFWSSTPDVSGETRAGESRAWVVTFCGGNASLRWYVVEPSAQLPDRLYVRAVRTATP